uniref:HsvB n=1 Tax=Ganoderma boninense TaxID=34458 RepID=A0A5K1JY72_9APHY|nr:HsvB [Ganoderma boninense]
MMMAKSAVALDCDDFARAFLPQSVATYNSASSSRHIFSSLEHADALSDHEISELIIHAFNGNLVAEGSTMSHFRPYAVTLLNTSTSNAAIFRAEDTKTSAQPSWVEQRIPLSFFRHCVGSDPFDTTSHDDEYGEIKMVRSKVFNHLNAAVELLFAAQQRVFLFSLVIIGRRFRLLRWDRAGIITTPSIDYYEQPDLLCDYVWRLSHLDDAALGFDPSATRVLPGDVNFLTMDFAALENPNDADHAERVLRDNESTDPTTFEYARTLFRTSLASDWPRYKVQVSCGTTDRNFLIGRPTFRASGVFGRGTRGYVALDCKTDVLQKLNGAGVENIPTLLCHGDVYDQRTVTGEWWERGQSLSSLPSPPCALSSTPSSRMRSTSPSSKKRKRVNDNAEDPTLCSQADVPLRQHRHYRIVVAEVALPLDHFRNGKQLASIILDAMQGKLSLSATNPTTLILHRDISGGNILIHPRVRRNEDGVHTIVWGGILSDWELSKPVDDEHSPSKATQAEQVGTYQFMSVNLLSHPSKAVKISDELESFFHVLVYYSIRYLRSNCAHPMSYIDNYFNNYAGPDVCTHAVGNRWQ